MPQKTAWFRDHRIRYALTKGSINKLSGQVEADETCIGGAARNMHASKRAKKITARGPKDKTIVMGVLERGGEVRAKVVETNRRPVVQGYISIVVQFVAHSSDLFQPKEYSIAIAFGIAQTP